jgi:hypothetical protein
MKNLYPLFASLALFAAGCAKTEDTDETDTTDTSVSACATFCADYATTCAATVAFDDCETACAGWAEGTEGDTSGNTLACRAYHLGAASTDAATHCPHAAADGGGVCID